LYSAGDLFDGIYILRSGSAKSVIHSSDGEQYVGNFLLPGDILGLDGFSQHRYQSSVLFLETSSVVFYKEADIHKLIQTSEIFRTDLLQQMSTALVLEEERQLARREFSSKQRVAAFLLSYSQRLKSCGLSHKAFTLSMSRTDIADHTGMVIETVSRAFKQLQQANFIAFKHRDLSIVNEAGLKGLLWHKHDFKYND
jgi:CRP/FNR family transcriptional regulator